MFATGNFLEKKFTFKIAKNVLLDKKNRELVFLAPLPHSILMHFCGVARGGAMGYCKPQTLTVIYLIELSFGL